MAARAGPLQGRPRVTLERRAEADVFRFVAEHLLKQIAAIAVAHAAQVAAGEEWDR